MAAAKMMADKASLYVTRPMEVYGASSYDVVIDASNQKWTSSTTGPWNDAGTVIETPRAAILDGMHIVFDTPLLEYYIPRVGFQCKECLDNGICANVEADTSCRMRNNARIQKEILRKEQQLVVSRENPATSFPSIDPLLQLEL